MTVEVLLSEEDMKRLSDIAGDQANRLNDGLAADPMYVDIEFLLNLKNADGKSLVEYINDWYEQQSDQ